MKKLMSTIVSAMLLLSMLAILRPASAFTCNETIHAINPVTGDNQFVFSTDVNSVGYQFWLNVVLRSFDGIYTWQIKLLFDPQLVSVAGYEYGNIFEGMTTAPSTPVVDNSGGSFLWGNSLVGAVYGANGTEATLCRVKFEIKKAPPRYGYLEGAFTFFFGTGGTFLLDGANNKKSTAAELPPENGHYRYNWAPPATKPYLEVVPAEKKFTTGEPIVGTAKADFEVDVYIRNLDEDWLLIAVQFMLFYNTTLLQVVDVTEGTFMTDSRWNLYGTYPITIVEHDYIIMGDIILPNGTGYWDQTEFPNGEGLLFTVTFKPIYFLPASGEFTIEPLNNLFFIDEDNNIIPHEAPVSGTYEFTPASTPLLSVQPSQYTASSVGEIFYLDITISNLDALWEVVNIELKLQYDNAVLEALDATEGPFMAGFPTPPNTPENCTEFEYNITDTYVRILIRLLPNATEQWSVFPEGDGTLATITFNATSRPPAFCALQITDVVITDPDGLEIAFEKEDGYYKMIETLVHEISYPPHTFFVETVSDTAVSSIVFNQRIRFIQFNVTGLSGVPGFVNITIPSEFMWLEDPENDKWFILIDGIEVTPDVSHNGTHTTLHFTVEFDSLRHVYIFSTGVIPEFPTIILMIALLILSSTAVIILRGWQKTRTQNPSDFKLCKRF
jgi:hypothetical protein